MRSVNEDLPLVETDVEGADDSVLAHSQLELLGLVHFVTNVVLAFLDEEDLVDLVELVVDGLFSEELARLENLKDLNHKVLILHIIPSVETVVNSDIGALFGLAGVILREVEELLEVLNECLEQKVLINVLLYL